MKKRFSQLESVKHLKEIEKISAVKNVNLLKRLDNKKKFWWYLFIISKSLHTHV